ncbi:hypothetical protein I4U23_009016 [Adineta vaga]|nr:hypothetical protein I4U23_009016 [Adineta vaga]
MILHIPVTEQKKDDKCILEYHDERINDRLMLPILKISYQYFILQYGTMSAIIQQYNVEKLRIILREYFDKFIEYHLQKMINNVTIDSSLFGIQFLSVDKHIYFKFQSILRRLELRFKSLTETIFIYRNQLIWSGLNQADTTLLYSFFRLYYWPHFKRMYDTSTIQYFTVNSSANPTDELSSSTNITSQKFFIGNLSLPHSIIVIHYNLFTTFCVFHNDNDLSNNEKTSRAIELFQKDLEIILPSFDEYLQKKHPMLDSTVKNVYFNKINMAYSATIDWKKETNNMISNVMNTLAEDLQWFHPSGEVMVKRENDPWIIAKRSDMRELFMIVNQKSANLKDIRDKMKQIFSTQFNSIFLLE